MFPKPGPKPKRRRKNSRAKGLICLVNQGCSGPVDRCHIRSKGAGGPDDDWNQVDMCRGHHIMQHQHGWRNFCSFFPQVRRHLTEMGWTIDWTTGKVWHEGLAA